MIFQLHHLVPVFHSQLLFQLPGFRLRVFPFDDSTNIIPPLVWVEQTHTKRIQFTLIQMLEKITLPITKQSSM